MATDSYQMGRQIASVLLWLLTLLALLLLLLLFLFLLFFLFPVQEDAVSLLPETQDGARY